MKAPNATCGCQFCRAKKSDYTDCRTVSYTTSRTAANIKTDKLKASTHDTGMKGEDYGFFMEGKYTQIHNTHQTHLITELYIFLPII